MASQAYNFSKFYLSYLLFQSDLINTLYLKYPSQEYIEHYIMSVNKGTLVRLGRGVKSPIGDFGSLLWRRRLATLAVKELIFLNTFSILKNEFLIFN